VFLSLVRVRGLGVHQATVRSANCRPIGVIDQRVVPCITFRGDGFTVGVELDFDVGQDTTTCLRFAVIPIAREGVAGTESIADCLPMFHVKQ
jgi:hypothetical protein